MKNLRLKTLIAAVAALLAVTSPWALAQDAEGANAASAAAAPAESSEPAAPPAVKPRNAELMPLAPKGLLLDVTSSGKHLFVVGDRGVILVSNNGKDWAQVKGVPVRSALTGISFADEKIGYAVGHDAVILKTSDGGATWALQNFEPELEKPFLAVLALNDDHVIAVGAYGLMYVTTDGGTTWTQADAPAVLEGELHLNKIVKLNNGNLLIVGEQSTMGYSSDNGVTWIKLESPYEGSLFGAQPHGPAGAIIYGLRGNVYTSEDVSKGGWVQVNVETVSSFFGGALLADGSVALVGLAGKALKLDSSGGVSRIKVTQPQTDANGNTQEKDVTGSFSAAYAWSGQLIVVGELGVQSATVK